MAHRWPGNVRELGSVLYRAALAAPDSIEACDLKLRCAPQAPVASAPLKNKELLELYIAHGRNTSVAARAAGVPRSTFRGWMRRLKELA
jgi:transcriptional regulator of acetoin/glycerol metabolism